MTRRSLPMTWLSPPRTVTINVLDNDSDPEGQALSVSIHSGPANGSVLVNSDGTITYVPNVNFNRADEFTYTISDIYGASATATVTITVDQINDAGTFDGDNSGTGTEDGPAVAGTLTFSDPADGASSPSYRIEMGDGASNGTASIDSVTGAWSYTANPNSTARTASPSALPMTTATSRRKSSPSPSCRRSNRSMC